IVFKPRPMVKVGTFYVPQPRRGPREGAKSLIRTWMAGGRKGRGDGAPETIRTSDLCLRRTLVHSATLDFLAFLHLKPPRTQRKHQAIPGQSADAVRCSPRLRAGNRDGDAHKRVAAFPSSSIGNPPPAKDLCPFALARSRMYGAACVV